MKKTLCWLLLVAAFCAMLGELVFVLMPRKMVADQMQEFELPDIHLGVEK